jgi:hypothetical protein
MQGYLSALKSMSPEEMKSSSKEFNDKIKERSLKLSQEKARYEALLDERWRNRKGEREKLGFSLSRFSPASAFQLTAMNLTETGINLKNNYEDQIRVYRDIFIEFRANKVAEERNDAYMAMMEGNKDKPLDLSEVPKFKYVNTDLSQVMQFTIIDIGIIVLYILVTIAGTLIAFFRYDVR